jgi:ubiquinone/menaquinone biosynthesis C-methylase UbiE
VNLHRPFGRWAWAVGIAWASLIACEAAQQAGPLIHPVSGRRIAQVMGSSGAAWLDRSEREVEEAPTKAIAALGLTAGDAVADVGAGSGYYTVRLARVVGSTGRVYATDIQPEMLALVRKKVDAERLSNVELVLGTPSDPRLPAASVDLILMVDVYHELADPQAMLRALKRALRPGGRLVLIEFRKESAWVPIREEHKMSIREARLELEAEGYVLHRVIDVLPWQHILVFQIARTSASE